MRIQITYISLAGQNGASIMPSDSKAETRRFKAYVALYHSIDAVLWREQYRSRNAEKGVATDESPYGFHRAEAYGFDVSFARDAPRKPGGFAAFVTRLLGFDLLHAWSNRTRVVEADVVWTMTEGEGFAIALLSMLHLVPRRPIICNTVWLLNEWSRTRLYKAVLYRVLVRRIAILSVHSKPCLATAKSAFPKARSELMLFGVNSDLLAPRARPSTNMEAPLHILSMGSDKTRDWETLLAAFGNDDRFRLTIVCWRLTETDVAAYRNVTILRFRTTDDFVFSFHAADFAVVPMKDNLFSGITSALDAASVGVPVICSRTGGVPTYFDEEEVYYVPVGDAAAMREAAATSTAAERLAKAARARQRFERCDYSHEHLARQYCDLSRSLLATDHKVA